METLGIRNNTPLNSRKVSGQRWQGEVLPLGGDRRGSGSPFVRFESIEWGIRAAFVLLRTYSAKYHANCIRDIISRWAPPSENDTEKYIKNVCLWTGLGGLQRLTEEDWPKLVRAMGRQEIGVLLDQETINRGYKLFKNEQP